MSKIGTAALRKLTRPQNLLASPQKKRRDDKIAKFFLKSNLFKRLFFAPLAGKEVRIEGAKTSSAWGSRSRPLPTLRSAPGGFSCPETPFQPRNEEAVAHSERNVIPREQRMECLSGQGGAQERSSKDKASWDEAAGLFCVSSDARAGRRPNRREVPCGCISFELEKRVDQCRERERERKRRRRRRKGRRRGRYGRKNRELKLKKWVTRAIWSWILIEKALKIWIAPTTPAFHEIATRRVSIERSQVEMAGERDQGRGSEGCGGKERSRTPTKIATRQAGGSTASRERWGSGSAEEGLCSSAVAEIKKGKGKERKMIKQSVAISLHQKVNSNLTRYLCYFRLSGTCENTMYTSLGIACYYRKDSNYHYIHNIRNKKCMHTLYMYDMWLYNILPMKLLHVELLYEYLCLFLQNRTLPYHI